MTLLFLQNFASETHLFNSCNFYEVKSSVAKSPKLFSYVFPQDFVLNLHELGDDSLRHILPFFQIKAEEVFLINTLFGSVIKILFSMKGWIFFLQLLLCFLASNDSTFFG